MIEAVRRDLLLFAARVQNNRWAWVGLVLLACVGLLADCDCDDRPSPPGKFPGSW